MKKFIPAIILLSFFSCNNNKTEPQATVPDSVTVVKDSTLVITDTHYFWETDESDPKKIAFKKSRPLSADSLNTNSILAMLNSTYPELKLSIKNTSGDTLFLNLDNGKYLTEQIGSTGAESYLGEVVYNLTEVAGIDFVNINFKQGDHAQPGTYSRTDFIKK